MWVRDNQPPRNMSVFRAHLRLTLLFLGLFSPKHSHLSLPTLNDTHQAAILLTFLSQFQRGGLPIMFQSLFFFRNSIWIGFRIQFCGFFPTDSRLLK
jgi:hypothetical protein